MSLIVLSFFAHINHDQSITKPSFCEFCPIGYQDIQTLENSIQANLKMPVVLEGV